jgi:hypothetical protein
MIISTSIFIRFSLQNTIPIFRLGVQSVLRWKKLNEHYDEKINDYSKAIKTIGLLNIFSASGAILDENFLSNYLETACGVSNASTIIKNLESEENYSFPCPQQTLYSF